MNVKNVMEVVFVSINVKKLNAKNVEELVFVFINV